MIFNHYISAADKNILYGYFLGITSLVGIILAPVVSYLSDVLGRKKVLFLSLLLSIVTNILMINGFIWKNVLLLFTAKGLSGVATTSQPIAEAAVIDNTKGNNRSYKIGLIAFSMVVAMTIGPLLGAYLSDPQICHYFNLHTPLYVSLTISVINIILLMTQYTDAKGIVREHSYQLIKTIQLSLRNRNLLAYFLIFFLMQYSWALYYQSIPLTMMEAFGLTVDYSSTFLSVLSLCMALGLLIINYYLLRFFTSKVLIFCSFGIAAICYFALYFMTMNLSWWIFSIVLSIAVGLYYPSLAALMSQQNTITKQGWLMGCNTALMSIAWLVSSIMMGYLSNYSIRFHLIIEALCAMCALLIGIVVEYAFKQQKINSTLLTSENYI